MHQHFIDHATLVFLCTSATMPTSIPSHHSNTYFPFFGFHIVATAPAGKGIYEVTLSQIALVFCQ
jgi:hypothetical protein